MSTLVFSILFRFLFTYTNHFLIANMVLKPFHHVGLWVGLIWERWKNHSRFYVFCKRNSWLQDSIFKNRMCFLHFLLLSILTSCLDHCQAILKNYRFLFFFSLCLSSFDFSLFSLFFLFSLLWAFTFLLEREFFFLFNETA